jgi:hypothetical protein
MEGSGRGPVLRCCRRIFPEGLAACLRAKIYSGASTVLLRVPTTRPWHSLRCANHKSNVVTLYSVSTSLSMGIVKELHGRVILCCFVGLQGKYYYRLPLFRVLVTGAGGGWRLDCREATSILCRLKWDKNWRESEQLRFFFQRSKRSSSILKWDF